MGGGSAQLFVNFATLALNGLTLAHGHSNTGGAIYNEGPGTVTISNSTLSGNSAVGSGGAIWNDGTLTISKSTLSGNSADSGGAIETGAGGRMTIVNSTLANNSANDGGAIENDNTASIANSTLFGNSAAFEGGAISNTGTLTIGGTVVAASSVDNCANFGSIDDKGYNLEDDPGASCGFSPSSHDIVGQARLGPLANNGGPTQTMALLAGSPAIGQIPTATGLCPATDQRGAPRPHGSASVCDIGAYESDAGQLGGAPGKVELICKSVTETAIKKVARKRHKARAQAINCTVVPSSGTVNSGGAGFALATLSRGGVVYATGTSSKTVRGRLRLVLTELRPLLPGRYTLTLRQRHGRRLIVRRVTIAIG
jgi:hypothetical protein